MYSRRFGFLFNTRDKISAITYYTYMDKAYNHLQHENETYTLWEKSGVFNPDNKKAVGSNPGREAKKSFSIIMPPPNANDPLHVGHAMFISLEDIMIRYHRMKGDDTVWIPGTDHAGIETQFVFEKKLAKQGTSRFQFDRETLFSMIMEYVKENSGVAVDQMKKLGASADWSRFKFTLDPEIVTFVEGTFKKLHDDGLVYRDLKLVNYCTKCGTSYSELEVNHTEQKTNLYYVKYPHADNPNKFITVATTRPEPIFVDEYLAVHPDDKKHKNLIGKKVLNPLTKKEMSIIGDTFVDPEFGTGIVKLTPAHDHNDFDVAKRHNIPLIQAIDTMGKIMENGGKYASLKVDEARKQVVADLEIEGLIDHIKTDYENKIGTCYRCGRILETLPLPQFFLAVQNEKNNLVKKAVEILDSNETKIHGAGRDKILRHWLENLKDWNISRQIVWGIRIPVWYSIKENPELEIKFLLTDKTEKRGTVSTLLKEFSLEEIKTGLQQLRAPENATYVVSHDSPGEDFIQETDTFDTWFSSGQWPVVTLKTGQEGDFDRFYPTSVMETGYDILPIWVVRMMLMGVYLTDKTPFKDVYLHGLVRDEKGQKMSKSKGNVLNPLDLVTKYGADAIRMALVMSSTPGSDSSVGESKVKGMRNFSNKIWNAARFIEFESEKRKDDIKSEKFADDRFKKHLTEVVKLVTVNLEKLKIGQAAETVHNEFWHGFCDQGIEEVKEGKLSFDVLIEGFITFLKLLHPFAPFVTEAVWQELKQLKNAHLDNLLDSDNLISAQWPE